MELARAASKFTDSPIEAWDSLTGRWVATEHCGALQVFDRFISERTFGQKKRTLLVGADDKLDPFVTVVRLGGSEKAFMIEKFNEDVRHGTLYSYIYLLHEANHYVEVTKDTFSENAAGVKLSTGKQVVERVWMDIGRYSGAPSKKLFDDTEYTIVSMTFPSDSVVDTDCHVKVESGDRYNVDELYYSLDLKSAYGKRIGY
jgi:hypothetical protein